MKVHTCDIVLLLLLMPSVSASRVRLAGDRDRDEDLFVPHSGVPEILDRLGVPQPAVETADFQAAVVAPQRRKIGLIGNPGIQQNTGEYDAFRARLEKQFGGGDPPDTKGGGGGAGGGGGRGYQVFSDLDDTIYSSGGLGGGRDRTFYEWEMYPGAFQFMLELSRGPKDGEDPPSVVPVSRPKTDPNVAQPVNSEFKGLNRVDMVSKLVGESNGFGGWGLELGPEFDDRGNGAELDIWTPANTTFQLWKRHDAKETVFVGDNGKKDVSAAQKMGATPGNRLKAAFIHDVRRDKEEPANPFIHFFDTYYDAAVKALELGLISSKGLKRVQDAFTTSGIVQICQHQDVLSDVYPCIEVETSTMYNPKTMEKLPEKLANSILDAGHLDSILIRDCSRIKSGKSEIQPIERPEAGWSRCSDVRRVLGLIGRDLTF